jgi:hypothetical protein
LFLPLLLLGAAGCASSSGPNTAGIPDPVIDLTQLSRVGAVARDLTGPLSVQFEITVKNVAAEPIVLKRVELQTVGQATYTIQPTSNPYDITIQPGGTEHVTMWAPGFVERMTVSGANGPATIRVTAVFESAAGKEFRTVAVRTVNPFGSDS